MDLCIDIERWPLKEPFRITGYTFTESRLVKVTLSDGEVSGRGEAAGVYYRDETPESMAQQIEDARAELERGLSRQALRRYLPPGGARNAVDCALWDLEARKSGVPVWRLAGLEIPRRLDTTCTVGADAPDIMAQKAAAYAPARHLKLKLTGENDAERLRAVRKARPDAWMGVDANQAYDGASLRDLLPVLIEANVRLIEQPVRVGQEADLAGIKSPIPIAADESVQGFADLPNAVGLFDVVNIKLDKCGGLTEALEMVHEIRHLGMKPMVGCMEGTSLAMAPGCLVGQLCDLVDMDGAMFLKEDRAPATIYHEGTVRCPEGWGVPTAA